MGELKEVLGKVNLGNEEYRIELNGPYNEGEEDSIHIHNNKVRFDCSKKDFFEMLSIIFFAEENLKYYKEIKDD